MRPHVSAILLSCLIPGLAFAQGEPISKLERGARIRIDSEMLPESEKLGRFVSVSADTVRFRPDEHPVTRSVLLGSIRSIEVSRQTGTRRGEYAVLGALVSGVVGYFASNHNGQGIGTGKTDASQNAIVGGLAGAAIGGALGWWYGGKKKVEAWRPVDR